MTNKMITYILSLLILSAVWCPFAFCKPQLLEDAALKDVDGQFMGIGLMRMTSFSNLASLSKAAAVAKNANIMVKSAGLISVLPAAKRAIVVGNVTYWEGFWVSHEYIDSVTAVNRLNEGLSISHEGVMIFTR